MKSAVNISDPILDEVEKGKSSLDEPTFPFILNQYFW